jgi:hypothetical protein
VALTDFTPQYAAQKLLNLGIANLTADAVFMISLSITLQLSPKYMVSGASEVDGQCHCAKVTFASSNFKVLSH